MLTRERVYIIAEAGVNHNGSLDTARRLIDVAVAAGVDAIKFQSFKSDKLVRPSAPKAEYQTRTTTAGESQHEMLCKLELDEAAHRQLMEDCRKHGIQFLSSPFDLESLDLLTNTLDLPLLKIPSGEITNAPLLLRAALSNRPVILSTGMCTIADVEAALGVLAFGYTRNGGQPSLYAFQKAYSEAEGQCALRAKVTLLHCTTEYPAPYADANLRAMDTLAAAFGLAVGFSDHTTGIAIPLAAVARGAVVIEKHFTLDRNMPGPDHKASLEPDELTAMVQSIRQVEAALGIPCKTVTASEWKNRPVVRKSLVAATDIVKGEAFSERNLTAKRPEDGVSPMSYWDYLGRTADRDYRKDEMVD